METSVENPMTTERNYYPVFLINRSDAIGDTLLTIPMAKKLKAEWPNCKIVFLVSQRVYDLLKGVPDIDDFKVYHRNKKFFWKMREVYRIFKEVKPTHYFYVGGGFFPNFFAFISLVPFRGGLLSRWHTYLFLNQGVRQKRSFVTMHEMEYNLNLLSPLGIHYTHHDFQNLIPELKIFEDEDREFELKFFEELRKGGGTPDKKFILIHPGMTGHTLNWNSKNYGRLILRLNEIFPDRFHYVVSYTPSDEMYLKGLREVLSAEESKVPSVFFYDGKQYGIRSFLSLAKRASVFIGPSTGTTHMAAAVGCPIVSIYSPIKIQSSLRWGPLSKNPSDVKVIVPDVICGETKKCILRECPYYDCMGQIEVEDVVREIKNVINLS